MFQTDANTNLLACSPVMNTFDFARFATRAIEELSCAFDRFDPVKYVAVGRDTISLYLKTHRIAIHVDETHEHAVCTGCVPSVMMQEVDEFLRCRWVRINPSHPDFCIGNAFSCVLRTVDIIESGHQRTRQ